MGEEKTSEGCIGWFIVLIVVGAISLAWGFTLRNECHHGDHDNALVPGPSGPVQQKIRDPDLYFSVQRASDLYLSELQASDLVVVLSVSLHCRGCEKKLRKHLSKMEGVTSFTIDFMAKKVTVVGNITPLAVLMSVSKVKNAKLLTPTTISSPSEPRMDSSFSKINEHEQVCDLGGGTQVLGNIKIFFGRGTLTKHYYKGGRSSICITRGVTSAALVISHEQIVVG